MSADKRTVSTDALETLGTIIDENAGRDAIHLAVEPVVAGENLYPGEHIGLLDGKARSGVTKLLGIVDPFLKEPVKEGEIFWLVVYPRQITSLRHVWSHPDFPEESLTFITRAKEWVVDFAEKLGISYVELMEAAKGYVTTGDYHHMGSNKAYSSYYEEFPTFWKNYEIITGEKVAAEGSFFTCSC